MAFPTTAILDNFNRTNENPLSGGGNWANLGYFAAGNLRLVSNAIANQNAADLADAYWTAQIGAGDHEAYAKYVTAGTLYGIAIFIGVVSLSPITGYYLLCRSDLNTISIVRIDTATETSLADAAQTYAAGDIVGISRTAAGALKAYVNGVEKLSVSDTTYTGAGYIGVGVQSNAARADDFGGGITVVSGGLPFFMQSNLKHGGIQTLSGGMQ